MRHADKVKVNHYSSEEKLNVPLSDVWEKQAKDSASFLKSCSIWHVYTSSVPRAIQTWSIIADLLNVPITSQNGLDERVFVQWKMDRENLQQEFIKAQENWEYIPRWWESLDNAVSRFTLHLANIIKISLFPVLVVSHGRIIQSYLDSQTNSFRYVQDDLMIRSADIYKLQYQNWHLISHQLVYVV
jgi:broad specificity phosphatase PhoE